MKDLKNLILMSIKTSLFNRSGNIDKRFKDDYVKKYLIFRAADDFSQTKKRKNIITI